MERNEYLLLLVVVGLIVMVSSLLKGGSVVGSLFAGTFVGFLAVVLVYLGLEKLHS